VHLRAVIQDQNAKNNDKPLLVITKEQISVDQRIKISLKIYPIQHAWRGGEVFYINAMGT
jgi:hypothetical protein